MVILSINTGKIKGKICQDVNTNAFYSFQGIPYAKPPLGSLRFKAPQPIDPWTEIKDCTREGKECIAKHMFKRKISGSEDCLNLNVYTPNLPSKTSAINSLKPVMFFIHGGAFINGSNKTELYGPEFLVAEDIVLVIINYRLGYLGFISFDDADLGAPGNAALKDMVLALKWVQTNIARFGGDPNNVTVFGESAGGVAAHLLMLSHMSKGLMHKIIAQSGCAIQTWSAGGRSARKIAAYLGFHNTDDKKLLEFLQKVPAKDLVKAQNHFDTIDFLENEYRTFGVVLERKSQSEEAFLSQHPIEIILSGNYNHLPMIMGYNLEEGMAFDFIAPKPALARYFANQELSIPLHLNVERGSKLSKVYADKISKFYYGDVKNKIKEQCLFNYHKISTDVCFSRDIHFSIKAHMKTAKAPIYFYRFSLETDLNMYKNLAGIKAPGACHGDELGYLFNSVLLPEIEPESSADIGRKRMLKMWTNFAKYGNPTPINKLDNKLLTVEWKPIDRKPINYLEIGDKLKMDINPDEERMKFWTELYKINPLMSKL